MVQKPKTVKKSATTPKKAPASSKKKVEAKKTLATPVKVSFKNRMISKVKSLVKALAIKAPMGVEASGPAVILSLLLIACYIVIF